MSVPVSSSCAAQDTVGTGSTIQTRVDKKKVFSKRGATQQRFDRLQPHHTVVFFRSTVFLVLGPRHLFLRPATSPVGWGFYQLPVYIYIYICSKARR